MGFEHLIEAAVDRALNKKKVMVKIQNEQDSWNTDYLTQLDFIPFVGLRLKLDQNQYMSGTVQSVEWDSADSCFHVLVR